MNGGSKKNILNFSTNFLFKKFSILSFKIIALFVTDSFDIFFDKTLKALTSLSIKVALLAPRDIVSKPKDPTPEYKSSTFEFLMLILIEFECSNILKIFSFTESLSGLVKEFFNN